MMLLFCAQSRLVEGGVVRFVCSYFWMAILQRKTLGKLKKKKLNVFDHDTQRSEKWYRYHARCKVSLTVENYSLSINLVGFEIYG